MSVAGDPVGLISVSRTFIADTITPISAYDALASPGRSCLLESVQGSERMSRFSFIGLDYLETIAIDHDPAMLDRIRAVAARYRSVDGVPFAGGAVCVFAYDAARALEPVLHRDNLAGRTPPSDPRVADALVVIPGTWVVFDHLTHRVTLIASVQSENERSAAEERIARYAQRLMDARPSVPGEVHATGPVTASLDEAAYLERVAAAQRAIADGDAYQLQVGIEFSSAFAGAPFDVYRHIRARNPSPYMFFIEHGELAVFGASPEFLTRLEGRRAHIRPLAGTRPRHGDPAVDARVADELLADEKERAEHVMLVDLARNDLGAVCRAGSVRVDELMTVERYSHVMHIVSHVSGELRPDRDALDLFASAFPAGTVTGTPKVAAIRLIDGLEPVGRGYYAGSVAHLPGDGSMNSCIVLRSVTTRGNRAWWRASAGIVADSVPQSEYAEVFAKTAVVRSVLGIA